MKIKNKEGKELDILDYNDLSNISVNALELVEIYTMFDDSGERHFVKEKDLNLSDLENKLDAPKDMILVENQVIVKKVTLLTYEQALLQNISCPGSVMYSHNKLHWNSAGFDFLFWPENVFFTSILTDFDI